MTWTRRYRSWQVRSGTNFPLLIVCPRLTTPPTDQMSNVDGVAVSVTNDTTRRRPGAMQRHVDLTKDAVLSSTVRTGYR